MSELAVETTQPIPKGTSGWQFALYYGLFMVMGSGANWVFPSALTQEIPYFQDHLPEGLCIATYMNSCTSFGVIAMAAYVYANTHHGPIPHKYSMPALLIVSSLGCFLAAGVYSITAGGVSFFLYICCAIGGAVGALSSVIMNPFMTSFENSYISAARSGGSGLVLFTALIALAQSPGSSNPRFSVAAYMSIFGCLLTLPIVAHRYITTHQLGLRQTELRAPLEASLARESELVEVENPVHPPTPVAAQTSAPSVPVDAALVEDEHHVKHYRSLYSAQLLLERLLVSDELHARKPWLRQTLPYMATVGWVNFNTWGIIYAMVPFAMAQASDSNGSLNLSIAYQLSSFLLVLGDLSTTVVKLPILPCLVVFSVFCFTIYACALGAPGFDTSASAALLIVIFALQRFVEAHVVTCTYRAIATLIPAEHRQAASRAVGICDQISTTTGALLSTLVITLLFSCGSDDDDG